MLTPKAIA